MTQPVQLEQQANRGTANGYCDLDSSVRVPPQRIPSYLSTGWVDVATVYGTTGQAIQAAHDAATPASTLYLAGEVWDLTNLNGPLVISKSLTIMTAGVAEISGDDTYAGYGPVTPPYLQGTVLLQTKPGANAINIVGTGVNLKIPNGLGIRFADTIAYVNTGHGIWAVPPAKAGAYDQGLVNANWHDVIVVGHDGNHYAFFLLNFLLSTFANLRSHGGGGFHLEANSASTFYGNSVLIHPYVDLYDAGTAHGYDLQSLHTLGAGAGTLVFLDFHRPQCNITNRTGPFPAATYPTAAQYLWKSTSGAGKPSFVNIYDPDLENDGVTNYPIDFGGMYGGTTVYNGGLLTGAAPIGGFSTGDRQRPGVPGTQPTFAAGPAAGTGATFAVLEGDDQGGNLLITPGTTPGAAGTPIVTVTCPTMPPSGIRVATVAPYANIWEAGLHFYTAGITGKTFQICCDTVLAAGIPYQVLYTVIPSNV